MKLKLKKTTSKLLLRKIKNQLAIFLSAVFIVALAVVFFVSVKTVYRDFKRSAVSYFDNNFLDDIVFFGMFNKDDATDLYNIKGVARAEVRHRFSAKIYGNDAIVYGSDNKRIRIDRPYVYDGDDVLKTNEVAINKKYADAHNLKVGNSVNIEINGETNKFKIASLVSFPNYVFLFKDGASTASEAKDFAVLEINDEYFKYMPYDTLYVRYQDNVNREKLESEIRDRLGGKVFYFTSRDQSVNYSNYEQTLLQIDSFSYICPAILLLMAILLLYIIQRRNVAVERKQIGIMKAIGLNDFSILFMYIRYSFLVSFFGVVIAFISAKLALPPIFKSLQTLFDIPNFSHSMYIDLWIISSLIILFVCIISNLLAAISILKLNPAQSMKGEVPKGSGRIFFESFKWWNRLSFNTRYSVKNSFRSKTRYLASLWGMFAAISMTIFAQGFNNSFDYFISSLYETFALYDAKATIKETKWDESPDFVTNSIISHYDKASIYQARVSRPYDEGNNLYIPALIYNNGFSSLNIPKDSQNEEGIMIPKYVARNLKVKKGDYIGLELYMFGKTKYRRVRIEDLVDQQGMFFIYMERDYAKEHFNIPDAYNTIFFNTYSSVSNGSYSIENVLNDNKDVLYYSFKQTELDASKKQIATIYLLVQILILVAFLLGAASLYGVGVITLATRRYEFTLLKVMGYSTKEIMKASLKEILSQAIFAIPFGIAAGYGILYLVRGPFSSKFFDFVPHVYKSSYFLAVALLIVVVTCVSILSAHYISKLDMVEGLKDREE